MERSSDRLEHLVAIMDRLRAPDGCPWDAEQDYSTLRAYLLEECYEVADALDRKDAAALREELGDLLFQIVFLSRLAKEDGSFTIGDVVRGIGEKMVRRHPHIFGSTTAGTAREVADNWERIKKEEKGAGGATSVLDGIPAALPALLTAHRLGARAARVGFDWDAADEVLDKLEEEIGELRRALARGERDAARDELGDLLFAVAMLGRKLDTDPEGALARTNLKFRRRFARVERELRERGLPIEDAPRETLESLWQQAKRGEAC